MGPDPAPDHTITRRCHGLVDQHLGTHHDPADDHSSPRLEAGRAVDSTETVDRLQTKVGHLEKALASNRVIGAAVGIAMVGLAVDYDDAFKAIVTISQHTNQPLAEVAEQILHLRRLPAVP